MRFVLDNWYLFVTALVSGGLLLWPKLADGVGGAKVSAADAVRLINREKAVLIDVAEPDVYAAGHAAGARSVPLAGIDGAKNLPSNKALPVLLMCPTGSRASRAAGQLRKAGYERAVAVAGGLNGWREANLPVQKSA